MEQKHYTEDIMIDGRCPFTTINPNNMSHITDKLNYPFIYCWITSNGIVPDETQFNFRFTLYIQHYHGKKLSLCVYNFQTTWKIIKYLHNKAFVSNDSRVHFAQMRFPALLPETKNHRNAKILNYVTIENTLFERFHDNFIVNLCLVYCDHVLKPESMAISSTLNLMDDVFMINGDIKTIKSFDDSIEGDYICSGPQRTHSVAMFWNSECIRATEQDNDAVSHFLCQIFNSPSFIIHNEYFYRKCGITDDIKHILHRKAKQMLKTLRRLSKEYIFYDKQKKYIHEILLAHQWRDTQFHTLYICTRPNRGNKLSLLDHWTLKFEGNEWLLTLEWFGTSSFFVKFQRNDCLGQRVFWFSWTTKRTQVFTQRWGTLNKLYIKDGITAGDIGALLNKWLTYCDYKGFDPRYNTMNNNCQHFVRDFVSIFNENVAEYLTTEFHHRRIEKIMTPSGALSNDWEEYSRIQQIKKWLRKDWRPRSHKTESSTAVHDWLNKIGKIEYIDLFILNGFDDMNAVRLIEKDDLIQIGITKLGHIKIIWRAVQKLNKKPL